MKMYFFDEYKFDGEYFVGEGERFGNDISDYLAGSLRDSKSFLPTGFDGSHKILTGLHIGGQPSPDTKWMLVQSFLKRREHFKLNYPEHLQLNLESTVELLQRLLGPLGKNDFVREKGDYICYKFKFDEEWFRSECEKLEKLGHAFHKYHGFSTNVNIMPEEYDDLLAKKDNFPNKSQYQSMLETSDDQREIIKKYLYKEELTKDERKFLSTIDEKAIEGFKRLYQIEEPALNTADAKKLKKYEEKWEMGAFQETINVKAKNSPEVRQAFLDALNDMMHNVKSIRIWDEDEKTFRTEEMPINCFGYYVLYALQSLQTNKAYYKCESCGRAIFINHKSLRVCEGCKTRRRQRKFNIKKDIEKGLSLEQILKNRNRMDRDELIQFYNELTTN